MLETYVLACIRQLNEQIKRDGNTGVSSKPIEFYNQDMVRGGLLVLNKLLKLLKGNGETS